MLIELGLLGLTGFCLGEIIDVKQLIGYGISEIEFKKKRNVIKEDCDTKFILGYDNKGNDIFWDIKVHPSISITGISNCGKSYLVTYLLQHANMPITLCNAYTEDFTGIDCKRIEDIGEIESYLDYLLNEKDNSEPLLVVFDEMLTLMTYKNIAKKIHTLLTKNRHKKIYVLGIFQELNKSLVPFKSLFTARLVMRQIQKSDIESALGITIEDYKPLQNREFILLSDDIYYGKTYDVNINKVQEDELEVIEEHGPEITEEVISEISNVITQEATNTTIQALVKEEIQNKSLSELVNEVDNLKGTKKK